LMSVEAKVDGEYCQIHVDVSRGRRGVQIFSKSGKDSTEDRKRLIGYLHAINTNTTELSRLTI
jgi:DNA ligase-4